MGKVKGLMPNNLRVIIARERTFFSCTQQKVLIINVENINLL